MHYFIYKDNALFCEGCNVETLARQYGTPLYVYSARTINEHFLKIKQAFCEIDPLICYSVKANSNLSLLKLLVDKGAGLDIVSGGELYRAQCVQCPAQRIVYASVGKTDEEIKDAIKSEILLFNVESIPELKRINTAAKKLKKEVNVALRVNPDIDPKTHTYITTGKKETKFGMDIETVRGIFKDAAAYSNVCMIGIHIHIGSQITESEPFERAIAKMRDFIKEVKSAGMRIEYFNIGGGLGIVYSQEQPQTAIAFAQKVLPLLKDISLKVILEPGRFIMGNAGILVAKVTYVKDTPHKKFVIVDAGMNDLIRPSLYSAYHTILPLECVEQKSNAQAKTEKSADIVGPICESADFLGKDRHLNVSEGSFLAVLGAGAYGFSMSSNYNSRPRPAEVLVSGEKSYLIRKRETKRDLVAKEIIVGLE